jgi:hypothetical protein
LLHLQIRVSLVLCAGQSAVMVANAWHVLQLGQTVGVATDAYVPMRQGEQYADHEM